MKHVLLICYYFPPAAGGGVARVLSFARHLPTHGWRVSVVAAAPAGAPLCERERDLGLPPGVEILRVPFPHLLSRSRRVAIGGGRGRPGLLYGAARAVAQWSLIPDSFAPWRSRAVRAARAVLERDEVDLLLTSSPPDTVHAVGLDLRAAGGPAWVADFRDPWIGLVYKRPPTPWHAQFQERMYRRVLNGADRVLAAGRTTMERLRDDLGPARSERVLHLPNGWEPDGGDAPAEFASEGTPDRAGESEAKAALRIVYTGTLWDVPAARSCFTGLARALAEAGARGGRPRVELVLVGPHESRERALAERLGIGGFVRFRGQVPYAESRRLQCEADVLLLLQSHGPGYEHMVPGKLYEYAASGRPIVAFQPEGEAAGLVRRLGGWVVDPDDEDAAARVFERLLSGERPGEVSAERRSFVEEHRRDRIAGRLAAILDEVAGETKRVAGPTR